MRKNTAWVVVVVLFAGLGGCSTSGPGEPRVTEGVSITNASAGLFHPSPDGDQALTLEGDSWCIADLPAPTGVDDVLPVTMGLLLSATVQPRCADSPVVTSPIWSPGGSRIVALGQEPTPKLYVLDPSSREIETILDDAGWPAIWVSETEILYYGAEPDPTWHVAPIDGGEPRTISAPRPAPFAPLLVDDTRVVYRTDRPRTVPNPGEVAVADLTELDWTAGTTRDLAALGNLNPRGQIADPGVVVDMTSDLRYAVLFAAGKANETGEGPTVYVYDLETDTLTPHTPPGLAPQTLGSLPFLVGDAWIAYTALADPPRPVVYMAPLDDPDAAVELFQDGLLVDVHNDRLTIAVDSGGLAILQVEF